MVNLCRHDGAAALALACYEGHIGVAALLLRAGAAVNAADTDGEVALYCACFSGRTSCAQLLLWQGAVANQATAKDATPLYAASGDGHLESVCLLLEQPSIAIGQPMHKGCTPLIKASIEGRPLVVNALLAKGARKDLLYAEKTAREWAKLKDNLECAAVLKVRQCAFCHPTAEAAGVEKLKMCKACQDTYYCSAEHQKGHWRSHKVACRACE